MSLGEGTKIDIYVLVDRVYTDGSTDLWHAHDGDRSILLKIPSDAVSEEGCSFEVVGVPAASTVVTDVPTRHLPEDGLFPNAPIVDYCATDSLPIADFKRIDTKMAFGDAPRPVVNAALPQSRLSTNTQTFREADSNGAPDSKQPATAFPRPSGKDVNAALLREGVLLNNRYQIVRRLGRGGFANVFLVRDTVGFLEEELALKISISDISPTEQLRGLKSQYKFWKVLSDSDPDRFVRLMTVEQVETDGVPFVGVFMEYLSGGNLATLLASEMNGYPRNHVQIARVLTLYLSLCDSIRSLHSQGMMHRDIKPGNVMLDNNRALCKLSDFELVMRLGDTVPSVAGTPAFMAPECWRLDYSRLSDIYALGVTLYNVLTDWEIPDRRDPAHSAPFPLLSELNSAVPPELNEIALRATSVDPNQRPQRVEEIIDEIRRLGITGESARSAPSNLARLLLSHLNRDDLRYLADSLANAGLRSERTGADHDADLIEEYCYTASPREVLSENCTARQLSQLAESLGVKPSPDRSGTIDEVLQAIGFRFGPRQIPGIESTRAFVDSQILELTHATTIDECIGIVHSGLVAVERTVDLVVRFFGQLIYGSALSSYLSRIALGKKADLLTFGQKVGALRDLCLESPTTFLPGRVRQVLRWPIIDEKIFEHLNDLVKERNKLAHRAELTSFREAQRSGRQTLARATDVLIALSDNVFMPRVVQIISREDDVYGRHFYMGRDDRSRSERIFTPLPLEVGQVYLFFPVTNPARINPIIFPYKR